MEPINVFDYETLASERLAPAIWDYCQGGSEDEVTLRANRTAFERIRLRPRMLRDVSAIDLQTTVLGLPVTMPVLVAPIGLHCLVHADGECATAQAANDAGTLMVAGTFATRSLEEIANATHSPLWFQFYMYHDLQLAEKLLKRVEQAGYQAIVLTVDTPKLGRRERDMRNAFTIPPSVRLANFARSDGDEVYIPSPSIITWKTVDWLRSITPLPIVLKGILTAEDATLAATCGIDGIIVSNHGGRQLDGVMPAIEALPEIVQASAGRCEVYLDGGIRRGTDVLKALASGARAVFVGRPILWGLAVNGREGVRHVLELLRAELASAMVLAGCQTVANLDSSLVRLF